MELIALVGLLLVVSSKIAVMLQNTTAYNPQTGVWRGFSAAFVMIGAVGLAGWLIRVISINAIDMAYSSWEAWTTVALLLVMLFVILGIRDDRYR